MTPANSCILFPSSRREVDSQVAAPAGSKITALVLDWVVQNWMAGFDSPGFELPDHFQSAALLRLFSDRGASFFVTDSLVQD